MTLLSTATCCRSCLIRECPTAFLMKTAHSCSLQTSPWGVRCRQRRLPPLRLPACQIRWIPLRRGLRCPHRRLPPLRLPACQIRWTPAMMRSWRKTTRGSVRQPFDSRCLVSQSFALLRMTLLSSRWRSRRRVSPLLVRPPRLVRPPLLVPPPCLVRPPRLVRPPCLVRPPRLVRPPLLVRPPRLVPPPLLVPPPCLVPPPLLVRPLLFPSPTWS